jgi:hypothetical protein
LQLTNRKDEKTRSDKTNADDYDGNVQIQKTNPCMNVANRLQEKHEERQTLKEEEAKQNRLSARLGTHLDVNNTKTRQNTVL